MTPVRGRDAPYKPSMLSDDCLSWAISDFAPLAMEGVPTAVAPLLVRTPGTPEVCAYAAGRLETVSRELVVVNGDVGYFRRELHSMEMWDLLCSSTGLVPRRREVARWPWMGLRQGCVSLNAILGVVAVFLLGSS